MTCRLTYLCITQTAKSSRECIVENSKNKYILEGHRYYLIQSLNLSTWDLFQRNY